ncbi:hypothetical protein F5X99DRAFT_357815 [Biscogniauxia marginata]|nr:hypothetical protein F5X99DRAFT_357815 [Biscogniauxia marginata]
MSRHHFVRLLLLTTVVRPGLSVRLAATLTAPPPRITNRAAIADTDSITSIPTAAEGCYQVADLVDTCNSVVTDYPANDVTGAELALLSCMCCKGMTFVPDVLGGAASSCVDYIQTVMPDSSSDISQYRALETYCASAESALTSCRRSLNPSTTSTTTRYGKACTSFFDVVSACYEETPGFETLPVSSQVNCYCYASDTAHTTWRPDYFGGFAGGCASWARTTDPDNYEVFSKYATLCASFGDVLSAGRIYDSSQSAVTMTQIGPGLISSPTAVTVTVMQSASSTPGIDGGASSLYYTDAASLSIVFAAFLVGFWLVL